MKFSLRKKEIMIITHVLLVSDKEKRQLLVFINFIRFTCIDIRNYNYILLIK